MKTNVCTPPSNGNGGLSAGFTRILMRSAQKRGYSASTEMLYEEMKEASRKAFALAADLRKGALSEVALADVTASKSIGGMRSMPLLVCETSELSADTGIKFRGRTINEMIEQLPKAREGKSQYPSMEALYYLLLTGKIPSVAQVKCIEEDLNDPSVSQVPAYVKELIAHLPNEVAPIAQLATVFSALGSTSRFSQQYGRGELKKSDHSIVTLADSLELLAKIPEILSLIFHKQVHKGSWYRSSVVGVRDADWSQRLAMGVSLDSRKSQELIRLYMLLHSDHESGNVSAHSATLVGSAWSDVYQAMSAGINGLAGPLHGLANQESLKFLLQMNDAIAQRMGTKEYRPSDAQALRNHVHKYVEDFLSSGQVVPGFGHAVLRVTDPRYTAQKKWAENNAATDPLIILLWAAVDVIPPILKNYRGGVIANPYPNVDCHSGALLTHINFPHTSFYTPLFGASRAFGIASQLVWARHLNLPIERPKSLTLQSFHDLATKKKSS